MAHTSGGGVTTAVTGDARPSLAAQCPAVPTAKLELFWKMKLAVHHANPSGTDTPPTLLQNSEMSHVPGPMPTGGRSTPLGVVGTVLLVGAAPAEPWQALTPLAAAPLCAAAIELRGTPRVPALRTCR